MYHEEIIEIDGRRTITKERFDKNIKPAIRFTRNPNSVELNQNLKDLGFAVDGINVTFTDSEGYITTAKDHISGNMIGILDFIVRNIKKES